MGEISSVVGFPEDSYGSVKRVAVFWEWSQPLREKRGGPLSILDFGCGTGRGVSFPFARAGDVVHGVDEHALAIEHARRHPVSPNLTFGTETADDLRERNARFDVIVCSEVLEHLPDPARCLRDLRGLIVDDGLLFVTVPNGGGAYEVLTSVKKTLDRLGVNRLLDDVRGLAKRVAGRAPHPAADGADDAPFFEHGGHVQFFRLPRLRALFAETGWDLLETRGRTLLCGPYADFWVAWLSLHTLNNALADRLPPRLAADWMFCARPGH